MPDYSPYRTVFTLQGIPVTNNFVNRPSDTTKLEKCLLPQRRSQQTQQQLFILHRLGGIGKTQLATNFAQIHHTRFSSIFWLDSRSEELLRQSLARYASRIPAGQIPDRSRKAVLTSKDELNIVVADVLD